MSLLERALSSTSESAQIEFKQDFNPSTQGAWVEIIKDVIAMANSGGGIILFGVDNSGKVEPEFEAECILKIDPADITNKIYKYTNYNFSDFEIKEVKKDGKVIVALTVGGKIDVPIVFVKEGAYQTTKGKPKTAFAKGTIYFRHGAKSEPATREDMHQWLHKVRQETRDDLLERFKLLATLPEGSNIQIVSATGGPVDTPARLLANAVLRRERDSNHLLASRELLWVFQQRHHLEINDESLSLLIGSGFRRSSTLYWWLQVVDRASKEKIVLSEVQKALRARDRDKSDAARIILEVSAIYAGDDFLQVVIRELSNSRYAHFRKVGKSFDSRAKVLESIMSRISSAKYEGAFLLELDVPVLERIATQVAAKMLSANKPTSSGARRLGDITRVIWYINSPRAQEVLGSFA